MLRARSARVEFGQGFAIHRVGIERHMPLPYQLYVFIDNSFLFLQGYKHVQNVANLGPTKHPYVDYLALRSFLLKQGELKRAVIVGSDLPGSMISKCQAAGFEVSTFPKYPEFKTGVLKEKGIDHKICWEIAKTIFTNKDPVPNKKIILCTGDKDFMTVLSDIHTSNWAFELWLWTNSYSPKFTQQVKVFGTVKVLDGEWKHFIKIGDKAAAAAAH
jgi:hypothetical protein